MEMVRSFGDFHATLVHGFCALAEFRDPDAYTHVERLSAYVSLLAEQLALDSPYAAVCTADFITMLSAAVKLHDVGKVGIPDRILLKPGPLTPAEHAVMKTHTTVGQQLLLKLCDGASVTARAELELAADIAGCHHERWDGKGYPAGRRGAEIPLAARLAAVADVYDALSTSRVYRPHAYPPHEVRSMVLAGSGTMFDPSVVAAFQRVEPEFRRLQLRLVDPHPVEVLPAGAVQRLPEEPASIMLVDDEAQDRRVLSIALSRVGHTCGEAESPAQARQLLAAHHFDLVVLDMHLPARSGFDLLGELALARPDTVVVALVPGEAEAGSGIEAMRGGAYDYLVKPLNLEHVRMAVERALERQRLEQEIIVYRTRLEQMVVARAREMAATPRGEAPVQQLRE